MTIRVLHLVHRFSFGGTEKVILNLLLHETSRVENFICSLSDIDSAFVRDMSNRRHRLFSLSKKEGNSFLVPFKISAICNRLGIDILHSLGWGTYAEGVGAKFLAKRKPAFIHSFRGKTVEETAHIPRRRIQAQHFFSHFCDAIVTPSAESRRDYAAMVGIPSDKIRIIYNGVDINRFVRLEGAKRQELRHSVALSPQDVVFGTVGRFDPVKNIGGLVRAFAELPERFQKRAKLLLVGGGPEETMMKDLVQSLGLNLRVIFAGMQSDVNPWLNMMDIYVQPSLFEGVPNAVLEAMAAKLPIVATDVGGVPEIVEQGVTGLLVEPQNNSVLQESMAGLLDHPDLIQSMGTEGRKRAEKLFSIEKMVDDYDRLYTELVSRKKKTAPYV